MMPSTILRECLRGQLLWQRSWVSDGEAGWTSIVDKPHLYLPDWGTQRKN